MAFWQFPVLLVPRTMVRNGRVSPLEDAWLGDEQPSAALLLALRTLLPAAESWSSEIDFFGQKYSDWIAIVFAPGRTSVEEISVRFDCRTGVSLTLIDALCGIVLEDGSVGLVDREGVSIETGRAAVLAAIERSPAGKFRGDPVGAIRDAADSTPQE